VFQLDKKH
jgi:hypothetical protein